jgi:hypothetical protein
VLEDYVPVPCLFCKACESTDLPVAYSVRLISLCTACLRVWRAGPSRERDTMLRHFKELYDAHDFRSEPRVVRAPARQRPETLRYPSQRRRVSDGMFSEARLREGLMGWRLSEDPER